MEDLHLIWQLWASKLHHCKLVTKIFETECWLSPNEVWSGYCTFRRNFWTRVRGRTCHFRFRDTWTQHLFHWEKTPEVQTLPALWTGKTLKKQKCIRFKICRVSQKKWIRFKIYRVSQKGRSECKRHFCLGFLSCFQY